MESATVQSALQAALGANYTVEREVGRGGMATVYLARDLRHRRAVAVKLLHPDLAAILGADRFLNEIELTAGLQHPHILPLFDSGAAGGLLYYVMPYVDGESLRARLDREKQLPVSEAVRLTREVADALSYAHARGVIHRDVKPENILLQGTPHPHALVSDFGIALAVEQAAGDRLTQSGISLGTPQYMSPEQAMGERGVDARSDVYALGAVLYEMLAGEPPFTGPTTQAIIARAMTERPRPLTTQRPTVPRHVDAAVGTALETLPADRFESALAFSAALANVTEVAHEEVASLTRPSEGARRTRTALLIGGILVGVATAVAIGWALGRVAGPTEAIGPNAGAIRFTIEPDSATPRFGSSAISPDGRTLVYAGFGQSGSRLYARRLDDIAARPLPGTENGDLPFFSPDGLWVGFYSNGSLSKTRLAGGSPMVVAAVPSPLSFTGGSWGADDVILYAVGRGRGLYRVAAQGGAPSRIALSDTTVDVLNPSLLPDHKGALVTVTRDYVTSSIGVLDLGTGRIRLLGAGAGARWAKGSIVYVGNGGVLFRQPFDLARREPTGAPEQIASGLDASTVTLSVSTQAFDASASGALVYRAGASSGVEGTLRLILTDRAGRERRSIAARVPWTPRFSPDGRHVAYGAFAPGHDSSDVWITDLAEGATQRLTTDASDNNDPLWSPDGASIVHSSATKDGRDIFVRSLGRPGARLVGSHKDWKAPSDWLRAGNLVLFTNIAPSGETDLWVQPVDSGAARPYVTGPARQAAGRGSPDGRWVTYESNETGRNEVYVQSFPVPGRATLVSAEGGANPIWSPDGRAVYYWHIDQLIAARVENGPAGALIVHKRDTLFHAPYFENFHAMYDVSRDGRFIIVTGGARAGRLVVVLGALAVDPRNGAVVKKTAP